MDMDKYIKSLIDTETRVNIPTFGAFLISNEGEKKVVFYPHINFDDGVLAEYVSKQNGCDLDTARRDIEQYVSQLRARLDGGEVVQISGVGSFRKENESVSFTQDETAEVVSNGDYFDTMNISLDDEEESSEESVSGESVESSSPVEPQNVEEEKEETTSNVEAPKTTYYDDSDKKKKTILIVCLIVLLFLIGAIVCLFVINKDNALYRAFFAEEEEVVEVVEEPAPVVEEPAPVVEAPAPVEEEVPIANELEKRYNIVVGSYKLKSPAEKKVSSLKEKGFDKAFVGQRGDWYVAIIESHSSLVEAERRQEEIVDKYRIESWITNAGE